MFNFAAKAETNINALIFPDAQTGAELHKNTLSLSPRIGTI